MSLPQHVGDSLTDFTTETEKLIARHRVWYGVEAVAFIVLGLLALIIPFATAIAMNVLLGSILIIGGIFQLITSYKTTHKLQWGIAAMFSVVLGALMLGFPLSSTVVIATLIAAFLLVEGIFQIVVAIDFRHAAGWRWLLVSGILAAALAILVIIGWSLSTVLFYGLLVGINLFLYGISLLMMSMTAGRTPGNTDKTMTG